MSEQAKYVVGRPVESQPKQVVLVPFNGGHIEAVQIGDDVWVPIKSASKNLGVSGDGQVAKLKMKPWATTKEFLVVGPDGKQRKAVCLHLDCVPMWLATIEAGKDGGAV